MLTTADVLKALAISKPRLYKLIHAGIITPIPVNPWLDRPRRLYFRREDVERLVQEGSARQTRRSA
ncbi:MAG TPA: helix-turn-helix domain-containing protein [Ktedonobacterales bacterium]|nr:helix-turn-helix domain-containing protein [Ktedonobacterales bacterium]